MRPGLGSSSLCIVLALLGCSDDPTPADQHDVADGLAVEVDVALEADVALESEVETTAVELLEDTTGFGVYCLSRWRLAGAEPFVIEVAYGTTRFILGAAPTMLDFAPDGTRTLRTTPFMMEAGEIGGSEQLLAWSPTRFVLGLRIGDATAEVELGPGLPRVVVVTLAGVQLQLEARVGAHRPTVGMTLDGELGDALAAVSGPLTLKHYSGTRRWFSRPGCDDDVACGADGPNQPCVTTCACGCDDVVCDCPFEGLETAMQADALAAAERISPGAPERVRLHWVFKRSLGGSGNCAVNGELDVTPATWGAFFGRAVRAAAAINERLGYRLIDVISPMNEANHPLQDGAHHNAAGQTTLGGFISFVDLIRQASCGAAGCCAPDRYIVPAPDVPALLAAAMVAAEDALSTIDSAVAPRVALSLYLDSEQRDPLQVVDGVAPSIVTPVAPFMRTFVEAVAGRAFPDALVVVDTYPGSWGAPWFETDDGIVHHLDPVTRHVRRVDPIAAADAAVARTLAARDAIAGVIGQAPDMLLGEVGWSTFDGDEAAQVTFVERLFDALAMAPPIEGFIWFKSNDRAAFEFPTWDTAPNPLGGDDVSCDAPLLGPILCAADVFAKMEGQWGLRRVDGSDKPAWATFVRRWSTR